MPDKQSRSFVVSDIPFQNGMFLLSAIPDMPALGTRMELMLESEAGQGARAVEAVVACRTSHGFGIEIIR